MAEAKDFITTKLCGRRVAGRAVEAGTEGQELQLTADEAAFELGQGTIVPKGKQLADAFGGESKKIAELHAGIAAEEARYAAVRARRGPEVATVEAGTAEADAVPAAPPAAPATGTKATGTAKAD